MTGLLTLLICADGLLILYGDMSQGLFPVFVAFLSILLVGLTVYSQLMIRCPHCSNRITGLVDTRDGKARGSALPLQNCRFCGHKLG
jgi:DNA-directed RNA polymerase subunit RPC12/RpoP